MGVDGSFDSEPGSVGAEIATALPIAPRRTSMTALTSPVMAATLVANNDNVGRGKNLAAAFSSPSNMGARRDCRMARSCWEVYGAKCNVLIEDMSAESDDDDEVRVWVLAMPMTRSTLETDLGNDNNDMREDDELAI